MQRWSLDLLTVEKAEATAYRLKCPEGWIRSSAKHARLKSIEKHPLNKEQDRIIRKYQIRKAFETYISDRKNWRDAKKTPSAKVLHWYADDSGYKGNYGAGLYGLGEDYRDYWSLGSLSTVFQAEPGCHKSSPETHDPVAAGVGDDESFGKTGTEEQDYLGLGPWSHRNPGQ
ncbi:hypothetical protein PV325_000315 [Microctonus aethiopoides]|nr:hypothetical protein PV325_000315 [Microctonus aethiopoides]